MDLRDFLLEQIAVAEERLLGLKVGSVPWNRISDRISNLQDELNSYSAGGDDFGDEIPF